MKADRKVNDDDKEQMVGYIVLALFGVALVVIFILANYYNQ